MNIKGQVGYQMLKVFAFPLESVDLLAGGVEGRIATQTLLACFHELLGPRGEVVGLDSFTPTPVFTSIPTPPTPKPIPTAVPTPTRTALPPNLVPFQPERWNAPLVFSDTRASFLDFPPPGGTEFAINTEVFVHWAVRNEGELAWWDEVPFQVVLTMDGDPWLTFSLESLGQNEIARRMNIKKIMDSPGNHQFMLIVDMGNEVAESNEFDNIFLVNTRWIDRS